MSDQMILISVYTRPVDPDAYPAGLANAVHLAYQGPDGERQPLNRNYGMLFPRGYVSDEDTIVPLGVVRPSIFAMKDGCIGILGHLVYESGEPAPRPEGGCFLWKTRDLIRFEEVGPVDGKDYPVSDTLAVNEAIAKAAILYWSPIRQEKVVMPEEVAVKRPSDLEKVVAEVVYSDGSRGIKTVQWDIGAVDFSTPGVQEIGGIIRRQAFPFPLVKGYGDPVIFPWEGKWHFLGTNDNLDDIGLYIRESDTVEGLLADLLGPGMAPDRRGGVHPFRSQRTHMGPPVPYDASEKGRQRDPCRGLGKPGARRAHGRQPAHHRWHHPGHDLHPRGKRRLCDLVLSAAHRHTEGYWIDAVHRDGGRKEALAADLRTGAAHSSPVWLGKRGRDHQ